MLYAPNIFCPYCKGEIYEKKETRGLELWLKQKPEHIKKRILILRQKMNYEKGAVSVNTNLKRGISCLLTFGLLLGNTSLSFAQTRKDKESIIITQEDIDLTSKLREEHKSLEKNISVAKERSVKITEEAGTRAKIFEEVDPNDTFRNSDLLYLGERYKCYIENSNEVDVFEIQFPRDGIAKIELWSIPSGCDYDLFLYDEDYDELARSKNGDNDDELIKLSVSAEDTCYIWIESYEGYGYEDFEYYYVDVTLEEASSYFCASVGADFDPNRVDTRNDARDFVERMERIGFQSRILESVQHGDWRKELGNGRSR